MAQAVVTEPKEAEKVGRRITSGTIDTDVHPYPNTIADLAPFLSSRWNQYIEQSGFKGPPGTQYPKGYEMAGRRDAWPPNGQRVGSDPDFARQQLLDHWNIRYAVLNPLYGHEKVHNDDFSIALASAINAWMSATWLDNDDRWRGSISVTANFCLLYTSDAADE